MQKPLKNAVTSHTEVWIEILPPDYILPLLNRSPPIRRCGLKLLMILIIKLSIIVTSHTEVWIEIFGDLLMPKLRDVTSHTEVWIEIHILLPLGLIFISHLPYGGVD